MDSHTALQSARQVGLIATPIGLALVVAPSRVGQLLSSGNHDLALRAIGALDLALVPGLIGGRRRREWLMARAALNLIIAGFCVRLVRGDGGTGAKVAAAAMVGATINDGRAIVALAR